MASVIENTTKRPWGVALIAAAIVFGLAVANGQAQSGSQTQSSPPASSNPASSKPAQEIPDAPSTVQPPPPPKAPAAVPPA